MILYYAYESQIIIQCNRPTMSFINDKLNIADSCSSHMHGPFTVITMGHIVRNGRACPGPGPSPAPWWQMNPSVIWVQLSPPVTHIVHIRRHRAVPRLSSLAVGMAVSPPSSQLLPGGWISVTTATVARERQKQLPGTTVSAMTIWSWVDRRLRLIGKPRESYGIYRSMEYKHLYIYWVMCIIY